VKGPVTPAGANAVEMPTHPAWTCKNPGSLWIWESNPVSNEAVDQTVQFYKEFFIPGIPVFGSLVVCADNNVWSYINGQSFGCDTLTGSFWAGSEKTCDVLSKLTSGFNYLNFTVTNIGIPGTVSGKGVNPAGLRYKLTVSYSVDDDGVTDIDDVDDYDDN
jgi:hypothetical protein